MLISLFPVNACKGLDFRQEKSKLATHRWKTKTDTDTDKGSEVSRGREGEGERARLQ